MECLLPRTDSIDPFIELVRTRLKSRVSMGDPRIDEVTVGLFDEGKMLRPELVSVVLAGLHGGGDERAIVGATAIELLHAASLVHDDLIDDSERRRGQPTVHRRLDHGSAILVGDLLLARGAQDAASLGPGPATAWARALDSLTTGQLMESLVRRNVARSTHLDYIALKTAALMQATCEIACLAYGLDLRKVEAYGSFGRSFGMAFQMADDVLDLVGDPEAMGKPTGSDARNGIITLPLLHAREREPVAFRGHVAQLDDRSLASLATTSGGIDLALTDIVRALSSAGSGLQQLGLTEEARRLTNWAQGTVLTLLVNQIDASLRAEVERAFADGEAIA